MEDLIKTYLAYVTVRDYCRCLNHCDHSDELLTKIFECYEAPDTTDVDRQLAIHAIDDLLVMYSLHVASKSNTILTNISDDHF